MHHHQRIHHRSRSHSPHDSPPRHSPPHDPHYEYCQPYATSTAASRPCPHCRAPSTSFHMDGMAGDLICTQCGAVLDDHLRDESAEWREFGNAEDMARGNDPRKRARCGELVDESKYVGGLMPTKLSSSVFQPHGFGGTGSGAGAGTKEEKHRLAIVRGRLKRTHNMIENMMEQDQRGRYREMVLERRARDARAGRGEAEADGNHAEAVDGGINVEGDYEGLMARRKDVRQESDAMVPNSAESEATVQEKALVSLEHKKWSLPDAVLLYGTLDQVRQFCDSHTPNGEEWTQTALEAERTSHAKNFDVAARASLKKLYTAFSVLEKAAHVLQWNGPSNQTFREALGWFLKFVNKNDGLRVKGISSGSSSLKSLKSGAKDAKECALSLSLFGDQGNASPLHLWSKTASMATELHRLRQYTSLGSAILYLSAKRTGVGRTLTEVCSAFGTYAVINSKSGAGGEVGEPLVRPKYCSRAMQELRTVLPEVVVPGRGGGGALTTTQEMAAALPSPSAPSDVPASSPRDVPMKTEEKPPAAPAKVTPTYAPSTSAPTSSPSPVKSEHVPDAKSSTSNHMVLDTEEAALADLVARMGASLDLPPFASSAAAAVAVQCARDARASATPAKASPPRRNNGNNAMLQHVRPRRRRPKAPRQNGKDAPPSPDVVAAASLLLVCMAGGTMQRLARQATSSSNADSAQKHAVALGGAVDSISNPLDDLQDDLSSPTAPAPVGSTASTASTAGAVSSGRAAAENRALSSWAAWNAQPPWGRDVARLERRTGIPRRTIVGYYSTALHPRRSYFLGVTKKHEGGGTAAELLHNITAAVPLMSLRNL